MKRDFPGGRRATCLYCGKTLNLHDETGGRRGRWRVVLDHLDGNSQNHDYSNLAMVHQGCNQKKRSDTDMQIIAAEKLSANAAYVPIAPKEKVDERKGSKNMVAGHHIHNLTKQYLMREIQGDTEVPLKEVCEEIMYLAYEKYGYGHAKSIERHVRSYCVRIAPWQILSIDGESMVCKRIRHDETEDMPHGDEPRGVTDGVVRQQRRRQSEQPPPTQSRAEG